MARLADSLLPEDAEGSLTITEADDGRLDVDYSLSSNRLELWHIAHDHDPRFNGAPPSTARLLQIDTYNDILSIFPLKTSHRSFAILEPKYRQIRKITLSGTAMTSLDGLPPINVAIEYMLDELPSCFVKDWDYGLGLVKSHGAIISAAEELTQCDELNISSIGPDTVSTQGTVLYIPTDDFHAIRLSIGRTISNSRTAAKAVKDGITYNYLAEHLGKVTKTISLGRNPLRKQVTRLLLDEDEPLSQEEQDTLLDALTKASGALGQLEPERLARLQGEIELVALDSLIERFEAMLQRNYPEPKWQEFLKENTFVLQLAFGYPIVIVGEKTAVGGQKLTGGGTKFNDFLVKNSMTDNTALIEIKTPQTNLLTSREYRAGVYTPSSDLTAAINQALDQKQHFEEGFVPLKHNSKITTLESYSVQCCLIVGTLPVEEEKIRSFELFRGNSKSVAIVTFDELLEKLKNLRQFLMSPQKDSGESRYNDVPADLPFP